MAKNKKQPEVVTLVRTSDNREYRTSDKAEINSLRTQGYRIKDDGKQRPAARPKTTSSNSQ